MRAHSVTVVLLSVVGLIRFVTSDVIPSPAVCATFPNEEFAIDLARCQNTCEFYGRTWDCPISYKPNGDCFCKPGFARIKEGGKCVSVTNNANCVAKLPISPASCNGPSEIYTEFLEMNACDRNCQTYGCRRIGPYDGKQYKWSPHCACGENTEEYSTNIKDYRRLSSGSCVVVSDAQCVAEFQPSPARCAALGQVYKVNAPCQQGCHGKQYCPPPGDACVCPPNQYAIVHDASYVNYQPSGYVWNPFTVISCHHPASCPATKPGGGSGGND